MKTIPRFINHMTVPFHHRGKKLMQAIVLPLFMLLVFSAVAPLQGQNLVFTFSDDGSGGTNVVVSGGTAVAVGSSNNPLIGVRSTSDGGNVGFGFIDDSFNFAAFQGLGFGNFSDTLELTAGGGLSSGVINSFYFNGTVFTPLYLSGNASAGATLSAIAAPDTSGNFSIDYSNFALLYGTTILNNEDGWEFVFAGSSIEELELSSSAIPMNLAIGQISANVHNHGIQGISSRLFRSRGKTMVDTKVQRFPVSFNHSSKLPTQQGSTSATDPNAVASGENFEYFASANFGNVGLDNLGANPGLDAYTYSSTVGFEYKVSQQLALGFGWSHVWNDNTLNGGLGSVDIEGDAAALYATYFKNNFWTDMLYSYGSYDADIRRNNGGGTSVASPDIQAHQVSLNMGYNIEAEISNGWLAQLTDGDNRLVYGPTLGVDYSIGALDGYAETGSPGFDAAFSEQNYDSLITRIGGQATQTTGTSWGHLKSQLRLEYARENRNQSNSVSGSLVSNPLVTATRTDISPGTDWLEAGAGISLDLNSSVTVYLDYTGQYFRQDVTAHYATIGAKISF